MRDLKDQTLRSRHVCLTHELNSTHLNLARFDLVSIRLAVSCAQNESLTAAARDSHLALAAASRRIRELEVAVGEALFERSARGLVPTSAGRIFARHGLILLQQIESMGIELEDRRHGVDRHVRLCASTAAINQFLPPLLARYAQIAPNIRVDLEELVSEQVAAYLRDGRAEVGILVEGPDDTGLDTCLFAKDELQLVLPVQHPLAAIRSPICFQDTLSEDYISLNTGAAILQRQLQSAQAVGRPLKLRIQVRSFDAVCHLVAAGLGIAILPKAAVLPILRSMMLVSRPLSDNWARRSLIVATRAGQRDTAVMDLVHFLKCRRYPQRVGLQSAAQVTEQ